MTAPCPVETARASRVAQGLAPTVSDAEALSRVAVLLDAPQEVPRG